MQSSTPTSARSTLFRQLAVATRRDIPLQSVLSILAQDQHWFGPTRGAVAEVVTRTAGGESLTAAMSRFPAVFAPETVRLLNLAKVAGCLAETFDALAADYRNESESHRMVRQILSWPLAVVVTGLLVTLMMSIFVLPQFRDFYASFGARLPLATRALMALSSFIQSYWWAGVGVIGLAIVIRRRDPTLFGLTDLVRSTIGFVPFVRRYDTARCATRLVNWLHVLREHSQLRTAALAHLRATSATSRLRTGIAKIETALGSGALLSDALKADPAIPRRLALFAQLGETLRTFDEPLAQLRELLEAEESDALGGLERGVTLSLYGVLSISVGSLVASIYMPILHLGASI